MKIDPNRNIQSPTELSRSKTTQQKKPVSTETAFTASAQLSDRLAATPDVRPDAVSKAKQLIADPNYPDSKTVDTIARKLADEI